jgi:DNA-directed RNA polymerase subunit RPC12/RpoP
MMMNIKCPSCGTEGSQSLLKPDYAGPYRCWKCRELFYITIEDNQVTHMEPITEERLKELQAEHRQEEEQRRQIEELKDKFRRPQG